jgi:hypothetical protein
MSSTSILLALNLRAFAMLRTCTATLDGKLTLWRTVLLSVLISPLCTKVVQDWERARYAGRTKYARTGNAAPPTHAMGTALEQVAPAKYNSLLAHPHLGARQRSLASAEAVGIAVRAVSRRDGYDPLARIELLGELAEYFQGLVRFPEVAREGLTDEQYVRSVLRVIYGGGRG